MFSPGWSTGGCISIVKSRFSNIMAWSNLLLLSAAVLKFVPLIYSFRPGLDLGTLPADDPLRMQRIWAIDLVSDTGYLLLIWFILGMLNYRLVGRYRWLPWRK